MKVTKPEPAGEATELCPNCGSVMVTEEGETYCLKCASEIDWGLEESAAKDDGDDVD
jgi:uncharacterized Zn finger protein (UPF0148 family)